MTNEAPETDEVPTVERMGYYKDAKILFANAEGDSSAVAD